MSLCPHSPSGHVEQTVLQHVCLHRKAHWDSQLGFHGTWDRGPQQNFPGDSAHISGPGYALASLHVLFVWVPHGLLPAPVSSACSAGVLAPCCSCWTSALASLGGIGRLQPQLPHSQHCFPSSSQDESGLLQERREDSEARHLQPSERHLRLQRQRLHR